MRSKIEKTPLKQLLNFKNVDWGLHFCPTVIKNKNIIGYHGPIVNLGQDVKNNYGLNILKSTIDNIKGYDYLTIHLHNGLEPDKDILLNNLDELSNYAKKKNVKVCIENLRTGFSSNPYNVIEMADNCKCNITFDIGHVNYNSREEFIDIFSNKIYNVHLYELEKEGIGHIPPKNLDNLKPVLDKLLDNNCDFWLIELMKLEEIINTKKLLKEYLNDYK